MTMAAVVINVDAALEFGHIKKKKPKGFFSVQNKVTAKPNLGLV